MIAIIDYSCIDRKAERCARANYQWGSGGQGRMEVGIVLGGGMYRKMATEATAMGEAMEAMATGEARRVMMAGAARATAAATTKTAVLSAKML